MHLHTQQLSGSDVALREPKPCVRRHGVRSVWPGSRQSAGTGLISFSQQAAAATRRRVQLKVLAVQSGWTTQPQPQPIPNRQPAPLARQQPAYQPAPVFLDLTQVLNKQVITRTSGRTLGCISGAWLDPGRGTLVSFDLDERKQSSGVGLGLSSPARAGNIPLTALRQIGDVVLVHDESGLYEQDLDGRLGFVNPVGLNVRTRTGEFLGKARDLSFSPDSGAISRVTYDEFGLPFLPISFFDCYSVGMQDVLSIGRSDIIVYDDAKYRERKESNGLFAAIPSLLKSLNGPRSSNPQLALPAPSSTGDMYRLGPGSAASGASASSRYLPANYTYEQWQADLRRWEAETGMTYEQYLRSQPQQAAAPRAALPPARGLTQGYTGSSSSGGYVDPIYPQVQQMQPGYAPQPAARQPMQRPQQQQQQYGGQQPLVNSQQQQQQRRRAAQQPQQQQQWHDASLNRGAQYGAASTAGMAAGQGFNSGVPSRTRLPIAGQYPASNTNSYAAQMGQGVGNFAGAGRFNSSLGTTGQQRMPAQQQQQQEYDRLGPQQPPMQQQQRSSAGTQSVVGGMGGPRTANQQQQQPSMRPQQQPAQQQQQQPSVPQQQAPTGRSLDDWIERDSQPQIADSLADGVLPMSGSAGTDSNGDQQQQPQQQRMQQEEVV